MNNLPITLTNNASSNKVDTSDNTQASATDESSEGSAPFSAFLEQQLIDLNTDDDLEFDLDEGDDSDLLTDLTQQLDAEQAGVVGVINPQETQTEAVVETDEAAEEILAIDPANNDAYAIAADQTVTEEGAELDEDSALLDNNQLANQLGKQDLNGKNITLLDEDTTADNNDELMEQFISQVTSKNKTMEKSFSAQKIVVPESTVETSAPQTTAVNQLDAQGVGLGQVPHQINAHAGAEAASKLHIFTPVHDSSWRDALSERITWMTSQNIKSASIQLNPPDLGPLEITIKYHQNQASVFFNSQHAPVRDAVEMSMPKLREMMQDTGVTLGDTNVADQPQYGADQYQQANDLNDNRGYYAREQATQADELEQVTLLNSGRKPIGLIDDYA